MKKHFRVVADKKIFNNGTKYNDFISSILNWKPDKEIVQWIDNNLPGYKKTMIYDDVKIELFYPETFKDLAVFIILNYKYSLMQPVFINDIVNNRDFETLSSILSESREA